MHDEIDLGKLTDRELLILAVQGVNNHAKRLDAHAADIKILRWIVGGFVAIFGVTKIPSLGGH